MQPLSLSSVSVPGGPSATTSPVEYEIYIVSPEDTLAGIALSRHGSIAEIKTMNKLWGNTIFPGQKLRVRKKPCLEGATSPRNSHKRDSQNNGAGAANSMQTSTMAVSLMSGASLPLLVRLRDLFDQRETLYAHHVVPKPIVQTRVSAQARKHLMASPQLKKSMEGSGEDSDDRVITIAAVMLRLSPFLAVNGSMTLTSTRLIFLPNLQDPQVRKLGATLLQVDVPITNITAVKRMQAAELEALILEDVGLRLQEEQRFLDVVFRTDRGNIVVAPRAMQKRKNDGGRKKVVDPEDFVQSLHFMMSAESLAVARTKLVQYLDETPSSASDGVPLLVTNCAEIAGIPSKRDLIELMPHIPPMFQGLAKWYLRFSTQIDGVSRSTLSAKIGDVSPLVLFVKTRKGNTFGAFIGDELRFSRQHYGSDRSFVFRFNPFNAWMAVERGGYFLLVNDAGISIGTDCLGGVALFIDSDLSSGESHKCLTFQNEPLAESEGFAFDIALLEIYAFVQDDE